MNPVMQWVTGNIGYHHVHHLNSRIPFYRLEEAMNNMPELKNAPTTSWHPREMIRCFQIKLWDRRKRENDYDGGAHQLIDQAEMKPDSLLQPANSVLHVCQSIEAYAWNTTFYRSLLFWKVKFGIADECNFFTIR